MEQLEQTGNMMRQACQPKTKASDTDIVNIRSKIFAENKEIKCFVYCILEMMNVMKKGKITQDAAIRSLRSLAPDELVEDQISAFLACASSPAGIKDNCEAAYTFVKCQAEKANRFVFV